MTTSFRASGKFSPLAVMESFMYFSVVKLPLRILSTALRAFLGSISVRKPLTPMFIASMGGSGLGMVMQVRSIVPSPPKVIMRSVFICLSGTDAVLMAVFVTRVSSA